jgi:hypothetical protein
MDQNLKELLTGEPIEPYDGDCIERGLICYAVVPFVPRNISLIEPLEYDSASTASGKYHLLQMDYSQLPLYLEKTHPPHKELGMRSDEALVAYKVKRRPIIVLTPPLGKVKGFPQYLRSSVLCAPLHTIVEEDDSLKVGYNPKVIQEIVSLKFASVFPLPTKPFLKGKISAVMLEHIFPAHLSCLTKPKHKVSNRWFSYIYEWICFYATGKLADGREIAKELDSARTLLLELLEK